MAGELVKAHALTRAPNTQSCQAQLENQLRAPQSTKIRIAVLDLLCHKAPTFRAAGSSGAALLASVQIKENPLGLGLLPLLQHLYCSDGISALHPINPDFSLESAHILL